jgi:hypothetical protein
MQVQLFFFRTFVLHSAECVGLNFTFLEMLPKLYQLVESEVKLYAACDTTHNGQRVSPEALTCAGPAVIRIKVTYLFYLKKNKKKPLNFFLTNWHE